MLESLKKTEKPPYFLQKTPNPVHPEPSHAWFISKSTSEIIPDRYVRSISFSPGNADTGSLEANQEENEFSLFYEKTFHVSLAAFSDLLLPPLFRR